MRSDHTLVVVRLVHCIVSYLIVSSTCHIVGILTGRVPPEGSTDVSEMRRARAAGLAFLTAEGARLADAQAGEFARTSVRN